MAVAELMERAGAGWPRRSARGTAQARSSWSAGRATTAATGSSSRAFCAPAAARFAWSRRRSGPTCPGTPRGRAAARGASRQPVASGAAGGRARRDGRDVRHRDERGAPGSGGSPARRSPRSRDIRCSRRCAQWRRRVHRRGRRRRGPRHRHGRPSTAAKPGLWISPGKSPHRRRARRIEIGIPLAPRSRPPTSGCSAERGARRAAARGAHRTKFTGGHVAVAGGCRGMSGAICLAARAAARAGAGLRHRLRARHRWRRSSGASLIEVMTVGLPDRDGACWPTERRSSLERGPQRGGALVLGPGLGGDSAPARSRARSRAARRSRSCSTRTV